MLQDIRKPFRGEKLEDFAYDVLQNAILSGDFAPGLRMNERGLAAAMGISRDPVRQAIKRLETEGFVRTIPRWGTHVREFTHDEYMQTFEVRQAIEICAARRAAVAMDDADLAELRTIADKFLLPPETPREEIAANTERVDLEFHTKVFRSCGNDILWQLVGSFVPILTAYFGYYADRDVEAETNIFGADPEETTRMHHQYVDAIATGDAEKAEAEVRRHIAHKWRFFRDESARLNEQHPASVPYMEDAEVEIEGL